MKVERKENRIKETMAKRVDLLITFNVEGLKANIKGLLLWFGFENTIMAIRGSGKEANFYFPGLTPFLS
jgi:hypothetical protein